MTPDLARHSRAKISRLGFIVLAATFLSLINSSSVVQRVAQVVGEASALDTAAQTLFEIVLLWSTMAAVLLLAIFSKHLLKAWTVVLVCAGVFASYYVARLNVGIDADVIRSILSTDRQEVTEFVDPLSLLLVVVVGGGAAAVLAKITIVSRNDRQRFTVFTPRPVAVYAFLGVVILGAFTSHAALGQYYAKRFFRDGLPRYSPLNLVVYGLEYARDVWRDRDVVVHDISSQFSIDKVTSYEGSEVVVIVIGESARVHNFQLAGYERSNNPRLARERDLIVFKDVTACRTHTVEAIPCLLTRFGSAELSVPVREVSLITILQRLGFYTKWYGTQNPNAGNAVHRICHEAQRCKISVQTDPRRAWDDQLLPFLKKSLERQKSRLLVVLHLLGSHSQYHARYPPKWSVYRPECRKHAFACARDEVINSYDNSILYTDHVLGEVIELLRQEKALLFYTPDHGESLGELGVYGHGWPRMLAPEEQMKVPLMVWASPIFISEHQNEWTRLRESAPDSISHDYFFHTVLGCIGVQSPLLRRELNLCADSLRSPSTAQVR